MAKHSRLKVTRFILGAALLMLLMMVYPRMPIQVRLFMLPASLLALWWCFKNLLNKKK
ncbi:MAG: hypothetical protein U0103_13420 [Candidatus Obscuribacterales bacterium]|nr:hypothetical protein [Cyanobacteria bacterium SZAS LIN-5]